MLREHPRAGSTELCARLNGISRATLTRALKTLGDAVIIGGKSRRTRYALRRPLQGNAASIPLYRIGQHGQGREIGQLSLTYPQGSLLSFQETFSWPLDKGMSDGWFCGLAYVLVDMRPQGFLGRNFAPAYDMLRMAYAPMRGGELPHREFSPDLPLPAEAPVWRQAAEAAVYFWNLCAADTRISADFRRICDDNGRIMATLLSPMQ